MKNENETSTWYRCREDQVRAEISKEYAIRLILKYGGTPDLISKSFDLYDQLIACEAISESHPIKSFKPVQKSDEYKDDFENTNGGRRLQVNFELNADQLRSISELKLCSSKTPPKVVAQLLKNIFNDAGTYEGWWLVVSQHYCPRPLWQIINQMIKTQSGGWNTIKSPAAYFTKSLCYRVSRKGWTRLCKKQTTE